MQRLSSRCALGVGLFLLLGVGLSACSEKDPPGNAPGTGGAVGTGGAGGTGSTGGSGGTPGTGGTVNPADAGATDAPRADGNISADVPTRKAAPAVYTSTNNLAGNAVVAYERGADGSLTGGRIFPTGGKGTGAGLGDQGALVFDAATDRFLVVNAGDNTVSLLALAADGSLSLLDNVASGGMMPISVTFHRDIVYVLNAGVMPAMGAAQPANIVGFRISGGKLVAMNALQPLSAPNPGPAQIQFTPDGTLLIVTEKGTNMIATFPVNASGVAGAGKFQASAGMTPFGFDIVGGKVLVVSEASGAADNASTTSSYTWAADGTLTAVTPRLATTRTAACWVAVFGQYAYVTNTRTNDVTSFRVEANGALTMLKAVATNTSANPIDESTTSDGYLYVLSARDSMINVFKIAADGSLTKQADLPLQLATAAGLVAR